MLNLRIKVLKILFIDLFYYCQHKFQLLVEEPVFIVEGPENIVEEPEREWRGGGGKEIWEFGIEEGKE